MNVTMLIEDMHKVVRGHGFKPAGLVCCPVHRLDNLEALEAKITKWKGTGWIARQSGVCTLFDGDGDDHGLGQPVSAELVETPKVTHQVRRVADGWNITTITEQEGNSHLAETVKHVAKDNHVAVYLRYWSLPDDGAAEVVARRLIELSEISQ